MEQSEEQLKNMALISVNTISSLYPAEGTYLKEVKDCCDTLYTSIRNAKDLASFQNALDQAQCSFHGDWFDGDEYTNSREARQSLLDALEQGVLILGDIQSNVDLRRPFNPELPSLQAQRKRLHSYEPNAAAVAASPRWWFIRLLSANDGAVESLLEYVVAVKGTFKFDEIAGGNYDSMLKQPPTDADQFFPIVCGTTRLPAHGDAVEKELEERWIVIENSIQSGAGKRSEMIPFHVFNKKQDASLFPGLLEACQLCTGRTQKKAPFQNTLKWLSGLFQGEFVDVNHDVTDDSVLPVVRAQINEDTFEAKYAFEVWCHPKNPNAATNISGQVQRDFARFKETNKLQRKHANVSKVPKNERSDIFNKVLARCWDEVTFQTAIEAEYLLEISPRCRTIQDLVNELCARCNSLQTSTLKMLVSLEKKAAFSHFWLLTESGNVLVAATNLEKNGLSCLNSVHIRVKSKANNDN